MLAQKKEFLQMAADPQSPVPAFTQYTIGGALENRRDEADIMADQDVTRITNQFSDDENMGAMSNSLESLEDEPGDFMRGELDVKEQMDRAATALDASLHGYTSQADEDSPRTELGASFRETPGGLEEVIQKTEQYMATHTSHKPLKKGAKRHGHSGRRGHDTGAYTDVGAGKSGVTVEPDDSEDLH